jgi:hypothetical protein
VDRISKSRFTADMQHGGYLSRLPQIDCAGGRSLDRLMLEPFWRYLQEAGAAIGAFAAVVRVQPASPVELPRYPTIEAAPLPIADRWGQATGIVSTAIAGFGRIDGLQAAAARQIDAADYSLQQLLAELSAAMPILPADGSALRALLATVAERDEDPAEDARILAA